MNWTERSIRIVDGEADKWDKQSVMWKRGSRAQMLDFFYRYVKDPGIRVLDLGCGPGESTRLMKEQGYQVIGVDQSPNMIEAARRREVEALVSICDPLPFEDGEFGAVFACTSLEWCEQPHRIIKEVSRVLKPGGKFVAVTLGPMAFPRMSGYRRLYGEPVIHNMMLPLELHKMLLEHGFNCESMHGAFDGPDAPDQEVLRLIKNNWVQQASLSFLWGFGSVKQVEEVKS